jgi:hypothetical protein
MSPFAIYVPFCPFMSPFALPLEEGSADQVAQRADVEGLLARLREGAWEPAPAVGEGEEFRCDADPETHVSALVCGGSMLHGSVAVAN